MFLPHCAIAVISSARKLPMDEKPPIRIANIAHNPNPNWVWIRNLMGENFSLAGRKLEWQGFSTAPELNAKAGLERKLANRLKLIGRYRGAKALARAARNEPFAVIVSHGPWSTAWTEYMLGPAKAGAKHLAFSFNFTNLPTGVRKTLMTRAFNSVDAFAVFTDAEQEIYANYFGIDPNKILRAPWGVRAPLLAPPPKQIEGEYFAALGGEARDYATLCETARLCPELQFAAVARPHNFEGLSPPDNLTVLFNLPFDEAWAIVWHAAAALIPLRSRETPCGLVTLIGGMHLGKAQVTTQAVGVTDYITNEKTGLMVPAKDPGAMAAAVRKYHTDPALAARHGAAAKAYATAHCSEKATIAFFSGFLNQRFRA